MKFWLSVRAARHSLVLVAQRQAGRIDKMMAGRILLRLRGPALGTARYWSAAFVAG